MKVAIVSDVHGNLTALEAVITDLERVEPDIVVHGGDLALMGSQPAEVVDRIRELGWPGVLGNTDEVLWDLGTVPAAVPESTREAFGKMCTCTGQILGAERIEWLRSLPREWKEHGVGLVHAVPGNLWTAIPPDADDATLTTTFGALGTPLAVYCHIHRPYVRKLPNLTVANSGSVGSPMDGDMRAGYLLITGGEPEVRRVAYDLEREIARMAGMSYPHAEAIITARRQATMPVWG